MTETLTPTTTTGLADPRLTRVIELVWLEAEALDRKDYEPWKNMYSKDGIYVVPIDPETEDYDNTLNMVYDDARMRDMRVTRMTEGYAIAAVDAARTVRTISRFVPLSISDTEVTLRSVQVLVAYKRGSHDLWASENTYTVRLSPSGDQIVKKVVRLIDSEGAVPAAGFLL